MWLLILEALAALALLVNPVERLGALRQGCLHGLQLCIAERLKARQHPDRRIPVQAEVFTTRVEATTTVEDAAGVRSRRGRGNRIEQSLHQ